VKTQEFPKKLIKLSAMAFSIPAVMIAGPLGGYFSGTYLKKVLSAEYDIILITTLAGLILSVFETIRIIKYIINIDKKR